MGEVPLTFLIDAGITDIPTIEIMRTQALAMASEGKTVMSWGSAGSSVGKAFVGNPVEILQACGYALRYLAPQTYGANATRTRVAF